MVRSANYNRIKSLVSSTKSRAENRVYYSTYFKVVDTRKAGILPDERVSRLDRVELDRQLNESLQFIGVNENGSSLSLNVSIVSLYDDVQQPQTASRWRLAKVSFTMWNNDSKCRYTYSTEHLIDYELKQAHKNAIETRNFYRIGSLTLEIVSPFSLARILINGDVHVTGVSNEVKLVPMRIAISTHATSDKLDFTTRFNVSYTADIIDRARQSSGSTTITKKTVSTGGSNGKIQDHTDTPNPYSNNNNIDGDNLTKPSLRQSTEEPTAEELLNLVREDRIDTPVMFQVELESHDAAKHQDLLVFYGLKTKRVAPTKPIYFYNVYSANHREHLFIWATCGHMIHLIRPVTYPNLVYGSVHSNFDYASYLYELKLFKKSTSNEIEDLVQVSFDSVASFGDLSDGFVMKMIGFKEKEYTIRFGSHSNSNWRKVVVNDFDGFACWSVGVEEDIEMIQKEAQARLFSLPIQLKRDSCADVNNHIPLISLASEHLLGGKGNSLIQLASLCESHLKRSDVNGAQISVPKGLVVSCVAFHLWLRSSPMILSSISELDATRRALNARSYFVNPLSSDRMSIAQRQTILREQCRKTSLTLNACPLPTLLRHHLYRQLTEMFGEKSLSEPTENNDESEQSVKTFAVRSSAVGEDSLETSAAGQMRTILDARGFKSICRSIVECWASQFELEAVTYKTQNGLEFNMPMAVVVQELIPCDVAGVATTCDPLTGNSQRLEITANVGLGEGVVAGKQTDTVRVDLNRFNSEGAIRTNDWCEKLVGQTGAECCLSDRQIVSLSNLLISLRRANLIKDREVEWGITFDRKSKSSSSSSSSSSEGEEAFDIHLLQSRPLTHLQRLSSYEIDNEHNSGFSSNREIVTRANLSEVMPGAMCKTFSSYWSAIAGSFASAKPFEKNHTRNTYSAEGFSFHSQVAVMVLSYSDTVRRFVREDEEENPETGSILSSMIGSTPEFGEVRARRSKFRREKMHPLSRKALRGLSELVALDMGMLSAYKIEVRSYLRSVKLDDDLPEISKLIEAFETRNVPVKNPASKLDLDCIPLDELTDATRRPLLDKLRADVKTMFDRLCIRTKPLTKSWVLHLRATILSMAFNMISMKLIKSQDAYSDDLNNPDVLDDFSILFRGLEVEQSLSRERTESGDVSNFLENLLNSLVEENLLDKIKKMDAQQLYRTLTATSAESDFIKPDNKCVRLFNEFMAKNGHRAFKEFDMASLTWADDATHLMQSLLMRARNHSSSAEKLEKRNAANEEQKKRFEAIVSNKITQNKFLLMNVIIPRARRATLNREQTKSMLIKTVDKYRRAFRYLGAQLCLLGLLPSADLVYHLTFEELDFIVNQCAMRGSNMDQLARILYKSRRRQQRQKLYDNFSMAQPTVELDVIQKLLSQISLDEMKKKVDSTTQENAHLDPADADAKNLVRGLVSCSGKTTGRAFVVSSIDQMDQIQQNDILITYSIDISWTVYFFAISGIVTEVGGIVSHGAVVAREYGIPTLCTAIGACSKFKTGQIVTLDANRAVCYLAEDAENGDDLGKI